jgi:hypothetical protein
MRGNSHVRFGKRDGRNRGSRGPYGVAVPTSRITEPSAADRRITERIVSALGLLDIRVLDHVIVSTEGSFSFAEEGLM